MKRMIMANSLTLFLAGIVLCYHFISFKNFSGFKFNAKFGESFDYPSRKIKEYGYVFRYLIRQLPEFAIIGRSENFQRFYLREEICASYKKLKAERFRSGTAFAKFISEMKKNGVTVIIVPIPTKTSIEREFLPEKLPSCGLWGTFATDKNDLEEDAYGNYKAVVGGDPLHIVDLYKTYARHLKEHPDEYLFVPSDTHWSSLGISLAAKNILDRLSQFRISNREFTVRQNYSASAPAHLTQGEFIGYLQIPQFYVEKTKALQWREPLYNVETIGGKKKTSKGRIILFGTSYSERLKETDWGFGKIISKNLNKEVVDLSFHNAGPSGSYQKFIKLGYKFKRGDILIWEFPTRHTPSLQDIENSQHDLQ